MNITTPILASTACIKKELDTNELQFKSTMASFNCNSVFTDHWNVEFDEFKYEFNSYPKIFSPCVGVEDDANLTHAWKELLLWHCKLVISMHHIQELMHVYNAREPNGKHFFVPTVISSMFTST